MKTLFLVLLLTSFSSFAGYVAESKINQCDRTDYSSPSFCHEQENESCFKVPNDLGECGVFKFQNLHGGPFVNEESCEGQEACQTLLSTKVCSVNHDAFINEDYTAVYCIEIQGKELVIDNALKVVKDAANMAKKIDDALEQNALARMDCGRLVIAKLLVRNASKQLTLEQVGQLSQTYSPIQGLLLNGSLETAKALIQNVQPDGVVVTAEDKTALIEKLDSCKP